MEAALAQVKVELGPDALILSSRTIRRGRHAFGLMAKTVVEVQAASERGAVVRRDASTRGANSGRPVDQESLARIRDSTLEASVTEDLRRELAMLRGRERFEEEVRSELRGLRSAIQGVLGSSMRERVDPLAESLSQRGLDWMHAAALIEQWQQWEGGEPRDSLEDLLATRIEDRTAVPREDEGDRVRVLVGAPGVGKTTTLAKLAARNDEGERDVALVSLDHYRIGATDQLRHYAGLLDSPFVEVACMTELRESIDRFSGHSVLIDTAGRGRRAVRELDSLLPIRESLGDRASIELVVDASVRREVQQAQLARFAPLSPDRIIFAKTDECESLADVANLMLDPNCPPVCWMGTGQRVPEDLDMVDARALARHVLGEVGAAA